MTRYLSFIAIFTASLLGGLLWATSAEAAGCCRIGPSEGPNSYVTVNTRPECVALHGNVDENIVYEEGKIPSQDQLSCIVDPNPSSNQEAPTGSRDPVKPTLQVSVPGLGTFSDITCDPENTECSIPWIGEYIGALYNYSLVAIAILAAVVMMIGGVIRLTAGSNRDRIGQGNTFIKNGLMGTIFALCSFTVLYLINPDLTILKPLTISYVKEEDIEIEVDLSKSAAENNISQNELTTLKGENPYQDACGDIPKCRQYGDSKPQGLVAIDSEHTTPGKGTQYLRSEIYEALKKVISCSGQKLTVTEGWRSAATQVHYATDPKIKGRAAKACCSNHGSGSAMDLRANGNAMSWGHNDSSGIKRCMNQNGLQANITYMKGAPNGEPWHWSPTGR